MRNLVFITRFVPSTKSLIFETLRQIINEAIHACPPFKWVHLTVEGNGDYKRGYCDDSEICDKPDPSDSTINDGDIVPIWLELFISDLTQFLLVT